MTDTSVEFLNVDAAVTPRLPEQTNSLTILVPVYNEAPVLQAFFERMDPVIASLSESKLEIELLFTDNCSTDKTFEMLTEAAKVRPYMRVLRFSRNVGFQRSILTGYASATGDACVQIDADLEDPPEMIEAFVEKWRAGYSIVYGVRKRRHEARHRALMRHVLYKIINYLSDVQVPMHAGDFRLVDRRVLDIVTSVNDAHPYLRGIIASLGFPQIGLPYDRDPRHAGTSSFSFWSYANMAIDGILQASVKPLYLAGVLAVFGLITAFVLSIYYLVSWIIVGVEEPGFLTLVLLQLIAFGLLSTCIAVLSVYVGRIYLQVLKRPISVVEHEIQASGESPKDAQVQPIYWPGEPPERKTTQR